MATQTLPKKSDPRKELLRIIPGLTDAEAKILRTEVVELIATRAERQEGGRP